MNLVNATRRVDFVEKADFNDIYLGADPREYFRVLYGLDYVIPELAKGIFRSLIEHCRPSGRRKPVKVIDLGCSYGINSALIKYPLDIRRLADRYACSEMYNVAAHKLALLDRHYFASWPKKSRDVFIGVDTSVSAISYARSVGLINAGITTNLEISDPSERDTPLLRNADLIISTGCVGYVTERTFDRLLACQSGGHLPIIASFVLRMYPYDEIAAGLSRFGMITEKLEGVTFVQRRFNSGEEFSATIERLNARGIDPSGKEAEGLLHAELFISRSKESAEQVPIKDLVSITSGGNRHYGRRFRRIGPDQSKLMH